MNKSELRRQLRAARRALPAAQRQAEAEATARCCHALCDGVPASYAALPDELDLSWLHQQRWQLGESVLLPRVAGPGQLTWHAVTAPGQLIAGSYGIAEPDPAQCAAVALPPACVVFVPGVAFTADGQRLGQGGGFYDRLLCARPDLRAIGVGFACQLVSELPSEEHDARVTGLVIAGRIVPKP